MQGSILTGISRSDLLRFPLSFVSCFLSRYGIFSVWHNLKNFEFFPLGISACGLSWYEIKIISTAEKLTAQPQPVSNNRAVSFPRPEKLINGPFERSLDDDIQPKDLWNHLK